MEGLINKIVSELTHIGVPDILTIVTLALLEGILSVDNALVLAILVKDLDKEKQKKALTLGIWGAFVFRFIAIVFATYIMKWWFVKLAGGAYLIYLAMNHMYMVGGHHGEESQKKKITGFWQAVIMVEATDIVFSIDSITTAVAMTPKIAIIWIGGILGIIAMRFLSSIFISVLEKFPRTEDMAYQLVFFVGTKLALESLTEPFEKYLHIPLHIEFSHGVFWIMMAIIVIIGGSLIYKDYKLSKQTEQKEKKILEQFEMGHITFEDMIESEESISTVLLNELIKEKYIYISSKQNLKLLKNLHNTGKFKIKKKTQKLQT